MSSQHRDRAREIFFATLRQDPSHDRAKFVARECAGDGDLKEAVLELLQAHEATDSFLEKPAAGLLNRGAASECMATVAMPQVAEQPESSVGAYKLLQQIGEGGFAVVYMAEQTKPVRRKVALKIIKAGMDSRQIIARFEAEQQMLAMMDHPNIAKVFDAGTTGASLSSAASLRGEDGLAVGRPYFVMELVHGLPITEFCDDNHLTIRQRLVLFVDVCRAVQHAHQKGIIHRDLKPSNVLTTMNDDRPMPKVIDFGISKALSQQFTDKTLFTAYGHMVGTPLYMSPEQAQLTAHDVDTRSDVYSLGVLLYELLTGSTPFERETLEKSGIDELRRMIREVDPPRPSVRVSTLNAAALSTISDRRRVDARKLRQSLQGELDWIVVKALEKDRSRRYESASAMAQDIQRYLNQEAVAAGPPSAAYRARKYIRRNRGRLMVGSLILLLLLVGLSVTLQSRLQANQARHQLTQGVQQSLSTARAAIEADDLIMARQGISEARGRLAHAGDELPLLTTTVQQLAAEIDERRSQQQRYQEFEQLARQGMDDMSYNAHLGGDKTALQALELYGVLSDERWSDRLQSSYLTEQQQAMVQQTAYETLLLLADFGVRWGSQEEKKANASISLQHLERAKAFYAPTRAFYWVRSECQRYLGNTQEAEQDLDLHQATIASTAFDHYLPGHTAGWRGDTEEAIRSYEAALRIQPDHFNSLFFLAMRLIKGGRKDEAAQVYRACRIVRPDHAVSLRHRAGLLAEQGELEEALELVNAAISLDMSSVNNHVRRGMILSQLGDTAEEIASYDKAFDIASESNDLSMMAAARASQAFALASIAQKPGELEQALELANAAISLNMSSASNYGTQGDILIRLGDTAEGIASFDKAFDIASESNDLYLMARARASQASALASIAQKPDELEQALELANAAISLDMSNASNYVTRGIILSRLGDTAKALDDFNKALELPLEDTSVYNNIAWVLVTCADTSFWDPVRAVELATKSVELSPGHFAFARLNTLGVSHYRDGDYSAAVKNLAKSVELDRNGTRMAYNGLFLAMAHEQLGDHEEAGRWYDKAVQWMAEHESTDAKLVRFKREAEQLLGLSDSDQD